MFNREIGRQRSSELLILRDGLWKIISTISIGVSSLKKDETTVPNSLSLKEFFHLKTLDEVLAEAVTAVLRSQQLNRSSNTYTSDDYEVHVHHSLKHPLRIATRFREGESLFRKSNLQIHKFHWSTTTIPTHVMKFLGKSLRQYFSYDNSTGLATCISPLDNEVCEPHTGFQEC